MKKLLEYLPLHFVVLLIVGIGVQFYSQFWQFGFIELLLILALISMFILLLKNKVTTTILSFLAFFFIGVSAVYFTNDTNYNNHYENYLTENSSTIFKVSKVLKPSTYYNKYEVEVIQIDSIKTRGVVLLNITKDSLLIDLEVDELITTKVVFNELIPPLNPHQFHYKNYLAKQGIQQQVFLESKDFRKLGFTDASLKGLSAKFRNQIQKSLLKYNFKEDELAVINALLLGQRQDISKELISDYSKAGAIHILAVSGLHVGVLLLILSFFLKPIERLKKGKFFKAVLLVLFLWMFAFIAGLSASVIRAVTMFTFLAVGQSFQRNNVVVFSLISSMFFLLLIKPMFLFDVGFQLSYLAVFGIVWVQPKLYAIWKPKFKIVNFFWQLFTVSIAAQVGILPLSLFYFQQFPGLFLASNLIIIPCLMYILIGGILVIFLALFNLLPQFFADAYGVVISWMNNFVSWVSSQEQFLLKEISISFLMMICWYIFLVFGIRFFISKKPKSFTYFLLTFVLLQSVFLFEFEEKKNKKELIVFHKSKHSIIGERIGANLLLQHRLDTLNFIDDYSLKSYRIAEDIVEIRNSNFKNFIKFSNKKILFVDSLGVYAIKGLQKPIVVLQYSPKINLERLIKTIEPSTIIADGSNYKSYVNTWRSTCQKFKIPYHYTGEKGAYILKN